MSSFTIAGWFCAAAHINAVCSRQRFARVDVGAMLEQHAAPRPTLLPRATTISARLPVGLPGAFDVGACVEQLLDDRGVADGGGLRERRRAEVVRRRSTSAPAAISRSTSATLSL